MTFPFSIRGTESVAGGGECSQQVLTALRASLERKGAGTTRDDEGLSFRGGLFRSGFSSGFLSSIDSGELRVDGDGVAFRVRMGSIHVARGLMMALFVGALDASGASVTIVFVAGLASLVVLCVVSLIDVAKFRHWLSSTSRRAVSDDQRPDRR